MSEPPESNEAHPEGEGPRLMGRLRRRLMGEREEGEEPVRDRDLLAGLLSTSEKARVEIVRMLAREMRLYFEALQLGDTLQDLVSSHSLELHLSVSLKPKDKQAADDKEEASSTAGAEDQS